MNIPNPDPDEELSHVNIQLFGLLDEANRDKVAARASFTAPLRVPLRRWMVPSPTTPAW
jgi:hypothetical protein